LRHETALGGADGAVPELAGLVEIGADPREEPAEIVVDLRKIPPDAIGAAADQHAPDLAAAMVSDSNPYKAMTLSIST
jgi:hypothetical protein